MFDLGGDEFVVLLENLTDRTGIDLAQSEIAKRLEAPTSVAGGTAELRFSLGNSICPDEGTTLVELLSRTDQNMYRDKGHRKRGRR